MHSTPNSYFEVISDRNIPGMQRHGFRIRFDNGYMISAVFGTNIYCSCPTEITESNQYPSCSDVEIAIFNPDGEFVKFKDGEDVKGRVKPDEFVQIVSWVSKIAKEESK